MENSSTFFDASSYPDYEKAKKKIKFDWNLIIASSLIVFPIILIVLYIMETEQPGASVISTSILIPVFFIWWICGLIALLWIRSKNMRNLERPTRITAQGIELSDGKIITVSEISKIRMNFQNSVGLYKPNKGFPIKIFQNGFLGDPNAFVKILKELNPVIEIEDINQLAEKYKAERKAKKDARKGL